MRNLLIVLLSVTLAALAVLGVLEWRGADRRPPARGSQAPLEGAADETAQAAELAPASGSRALLEGGEPPGAGPGDQADGDDGIDLSKEIEAARGAQRAQIEERYRRQARGYGEVLELTPADERSLYEVLLGEHQRRAELFEELRQDGFGQEARNRVREELAAIQVWKTEELQAKLGAELAQAVADYENSEGEPELFERASKERTED